MANNIIRFPIEKRLGQPNMGLKDLLARTTSMRKAAHKAARAARHIRDELKYVDEGCNRYDHCSCRDVCCHCHKAAVLLRAARKVKP